MATVIPNNRLNWRSDPESYALCLDRRTTPVLHVIPDAKYPGVMWRIKLPDGSLSDMVNLTRAKDAALSHARAILASHQDTKETRPAAPLVSQPAKPAPMPTPTPMQSLTAPSSLAA